MTQDLMGQRALVTGGSRGIGLAAVQALAARGAHVVWTGRSLDALREAEATLAGQGTTGVACDVADRAAMAVLVAEHGPFDILVNNAAQIGPIGRITDITIEDFASAIDTNLTAQLHAVQLVLPGMLAKGAGRIIHVSSGAAHSPREGWAAYCSSKAGLAMLSKMIHLEHAGDGIRSFAFAPGVVDTGMQGLIRASGINDVSKLPRSALAPADEPGRAIAWLATPAADDLAGKDIDVRDPDLRARAGLPAR